MTTTADSGTGSLRDAITQINADTNHALYASTSNPNVDEIDFNITAASDTGGGYNAATGVATIQPQTLLPQVTNSVIIDGYTQGEGTSLAATPNTLKGVGQLGVAAGDSSQYGDNAVLKVVLDGSLVPKPDTFYYAGLEISGADSDVQGLVINNFTSNLVVDAGATGTVVKGNFIGTDVSGTTTPPPFVRRLDDPGVGDHRRGQ